MLIPITSTSGKRTKFYQIVSILNEMEEHPDEPVTPMTPERKAEYFKSRDEFMNSPEALEIKKELEQFRRERKMREAQSGNTREK